MTKTILTTLSALSILFSIASAQELSTKYYGQNPPGLEPVVFAPGIISIENVSEFSCCLSPDGKEFYFARATQPQRYTIYVTYLTGSGWSEPKIASFSGDYFNHEPYIQPDGNRIFWGSERPLPDGTSKYSIWIADRSGSGWGDPYPLGFNAMYVTSTIDGKLYYTSRGRGGACIARAVPDGKEYSLEIFDEPLISEYWDGHPCVAHDESWLIFDSENRPESDECGLFISFKNENGGWTEPVNMKSRITKGRYAMLSPDGKQLFFAAPGKGSGKDIYWVDAKIVEFFRPDHLK